MKTLWIDDNSLTWSKFKTLSFSKNIIFALFRLPIYCLKNHKSFKMYRIFKGRQYSIKWNWLQIDIVFFIIIGTVFFEVLKLWLRSRIAALPQIKFPSTCPRGSVAAWPHAFYFSTDYSLYIIDELQIEEKWGG